MSNHYHVISYRQGHAPESFDCIDGNDADGHQMVEDLAECWWELEPGFSIIELEQHFAVLRHDCTKELVFVELSKVNDCDRNCEARFDRERAIPA